MKKIRINVKLNHALSYAKRGWHVLRVHGIVNGQCTCRREGCPAPGKHPATPHGVKDATLDVTILRQWFSWGSSYNIGVATGWQSNLLVVDVDPRNGGLASFRALPQTDCQTATSKTSGGGFHQFYKMPALQPVAGAFGKGIDVQGDGKYVVMPVSRHASGHIYRWSNPPHKVAVSEFPPAWLTLGKPAAPQADAREGEVSQGDRNNHLMRFAGKMQRDGLAEHIIRAAVEAENQKNCSSPVGMAEVDAVVKGVLRYRPAASGDPIEELANETLARRFEGGKHLVFAIDQRLWHFDVTHWRVMSETLLKQAIRETLQEMPTPRSSRGIVQLLSDTAALIKTIVATNDDVLRFSGGAAPVINCKNGELWIETDATIKLKPHSPTSYLRSCMDVTYDSKARAPRYWKAVHQIFGKCADTASVVRFWHELMGYALQPDRPNAMILMLWGGGSNGKSKLIKTLQLMLGRQGYLATSVASLNASQFAMAGLLGKHIFVDDDVKEGTKLNDGQLKLISENKEISSDTKHGDFVHFTSRVLPILAFNNAPLSADISHGFQRRIFVVPFQQEFSGNNPTFFDPIWRDEMSGILNHFVKGLVRVVKKNWVIDPPAELTAAKMEFLKQTNPVPEFVSERCETGAKLFVSIEALYSCYQIWAVSKGTKHVLQQKAFVQNLIAMKFERHNTATKRCLRGLRLKALPNVE